MATETPSQLHRRLLPTREAAAYLGIGRATLYKLIGSGDMPTVHIGSRTLIDQQDLDVYIDRQKAS